MSRFVVIRALGLFGIIKLPAGLFLIAVTKTKRMGDILQNTVWRVESTQFIQITPNKTLNQSQEQDHKTFKSKLNYFNYF